MRVEPFDTQRHMVFSRRAALFSGGTSLLFLGVGARLYKLQIEEYEDYRTLAEDNRFNQRIVTPLRGEIYDRFGEPIATNRQNFRVLLIPEDTASVEKSLIKLEQIIPLTEQQEKRILRDVRRKRAFVPIEVASNLDWDSFARVNFEGPNLPGLRSEVGDTRSYPFGDAAAFVVGYVGAPSDKDLKENPDQEILFRQPGFRLGRAGLERKYDEELRGKAGSMRIEVNAHGRVIKEYPNEGDQAEQGAPLGLTIDMELQVAAMDILSKPSTSEDPEKAEKVQSGAAVVMDIETGDIIVMASTPAFDPNAFNVGVTNNMWQELNNSIYKPLLNKPVSGVYPPGSTFKLLTAIAAQENGVKPTKRTRCSGKIWYGNRFFNCWKQRGHGVMDMKGSIKHSCDVYYWDIARNLDIDLLADVAKRYGLGQKFDLGIGSEKEGVIPSREWKRKYFRSTPEQQTWFPGETLSVAIGQGYVTSTPLQQAVMAARLASGRSVMPRLVRSTGSVLIPPEPAPVIEGNPKHLDAVREGMIAVVNEGGGTARRSALPNTNFQMAGKTGTSQVRSLQYDENGKRVKNEDLPWKDRDHALFVAYAPVKNPRYACCVLVEHGSSGSRAAGPKARDIMAKVLEKDPARFAQKIQEQSRRG